ncbi:ATP-binding Cassette (ABC) Superfamily, partial [Thraustotheca clavata]
MGSRGEAEPLLGSIETRERRVVKKTGSLSSMLFMWMNPLLELGNVRPLEMTDLYELDPLLQSEGASGRFQACWTKEIQRKEPSLSRALIYAFGMRYLAAGWLRLIRDILQFVGPFVIQNVITYLNTPSADIYQGLYYVGVIFLAGNIQAFCFRNYMYFVFETGLLCKSALMTAVYQKALRLSASARGSRSTGEITNLMAIDAQRIQDLLADLHAIWYGPCLIAASCTCLYWQIGPACYGALGVILLAIPLSICISQRMRTLQKALMAVKDERIKLCYEILSGIKVIKLQAWENHFISRVNIFRKDELAKLKSYILTRSLSNSVFNGVPALITVATFTCYTLLMNQVLDVTTALTSVSLFAIMRYPLFVLPSVLNAIVEASVSLNRLQSFLIESERSVVGPGSLTDIGVRMQDASFCWDSNVNEPALGPVSITAMDRGLIAVVGPVGSGKSTFLSGLLGDVQCTSGSVELRGNVAYVSQQPFIQNATVRDNICFGLPYEYGRYQAALRVSCLGDDLRALPGNDLTEIGEKGINLSGGQRTRVALARAVYQDADIYLLDDILAAVDSHVGAAMFEQCIQGTLKNKLVILVTNGLHLLQHCDRIVILQSSKVVDIGKYDDLIAESTLQSLVQSYIPPTTSDECIEDVVSDDEFGTTPGHQLLRVPSSEIIEKTRHLITNEDRSLGDVAWPIYMVWIRACGGLIVGFCILLVFLVAQISNISATFWLNYWASNDGNLSRPIRLNYIYIFVGLNVSYVILIYVRVLLIYFVGLGGSRKLFDKLLYQVIRAPMVFFDTTPLGRIVNRLSKDVYAVDEDIPATYGNVLITLIGVGATILTIVRVTPWFAAILVPLGIGYITCQRYFIKTSRELQRLESISRSPIYALMAETLDGLPTIRAYGVEPSFIKRQS